MSSAPFIVVACGLLSEARIAAGKGVHPLAGGGDGERLSSEIERAISDGARGVLSFGIAGGLKPELETGGVVVAAAVVHARERWPTDGEWSERLVRALSEAIRAEIAGVDAAAASAIEKLELYQSTGAVAVDMESHVAARVAARHGIPFAALRVIADPAARALPPAALVGMKKDGSTDVGAVLKSLARDPRQLPGLFRVGNDARMAFASLLRCRRRLDALGLGAFGFGEGLGLGDLG